MNNNGNIVRTEIMSQAKPLEEILSQIEGFDVDSLSIEDKTRLSKALQKKLGFNSGLNVQTFWGDNYKKSPLRIRFTAEKLIFKPTMI